jgi:hypothetical protein
MDSLDVTLNLGGNDVRFVKKNPSKEAPLPSGWYRARIKHFPERYNMSYTLWHHLNAGRGLPNGNPEVMRRVIRSGEILPSLTPALEWWYFSLFRECTFGKVSDGVLRQAYRNYFADDKAYVDYSGWFNNQSVVLGENIGKSFMRMGYSIPCGLTVLVKGGREVVSGKNCLPILALNSLDNRNLKATYKNSPYTIGASVNCVTNPQPKGIVDPFPILGELSWTTPFAILAHGSTTAYIEEEWVERLPVGVEGRQYPYLNTNYKDVRW